MSKESSLGLAELIEQVKRELLSTETDADGAVPLFSVDQVILDLQVMVRKEGHSGIKIYVVELGGSAGRDDVQRVQVTLSPIVSKEERIRLFKARYPEQWQDVEAASVDGTIRGEDL